MHFLIVMLQTLKKLSNNLPGLSLLAGASTFLAFEKFRLVPLIFFAPIFLNKIISLSKNPRQAFLFGFLTSFVIMLGGFYWVTYVLHEFGQLSWVSSAALFLAFCGFGALNFPIFITVCHWLYEKRPALLSTQGGRVVWFSFCLPAIFTLIEWATPKLFPWYLGHSLYRYSWWIQICEITGSTFLTFLVYSIGSTLGACWGKAKQVPFSALGIPITLTAVTLSFGWWTTQNRVFPEGQQLRVALIQANIGNLDKVAAKQGLLSSIDYTIQTYQKLTEQALTQQPELVVWPETAIPFRMDFPGGRQHSLMQFVQDKGVPLISGAFARGTNPNREFNAAFLFNSQTANEPLDIYHKNILLAFGEYLPLGETFPALYRMFPQVSDFERGQKQKVFTLSNGSRLGLSICYESIVPSFMRKVAQQKIHAFINLTNDSWFGPTSEPYLHAALTVFRAIEHRVPMVRVTNTGTSFVVNHLGKMSSQTQIYQPEWLVETISLPAEVQLTFYGKYGDWFIYTLIFCLCVGLIGLRRKYASVPL